MSTMEQSLPKVLVISHNVFSKSSNMGRTLANFFGDWDQDKLAQLYFHTEIPTTDICTNYFRITDFDIIKKRKREIGTILNENDICPERKTERADEGKQAQIYQLGRQRKPYMYVGRNVIWGLNKWKNKKLIEWVDKFNPDVIFFASGDYTFSYKIATYIAEYKKIPIVTYVCDDFYFTKRKSMSPLYHFNRIIYKKTIHKLFEKHKNTVMICDKLSIDYKTEFNINPVTIMTTSELTEKPQKPSNDTVKISYIGNLGYKRHIPIIEIGQSILKLFGGRVLVDVYSMEGRKEIIDCLTEQNGVCFHGGISSDEVSNVMEQSDILIHVESMDELNREKVKYSVSTKIADSLACGTCLFAYGPEEVASIQYLKKCGGACVVTKKDELEAALSEIAVNKESREEYIKKAIIAARENHNPIKNYQKIYDVICDAIKEG